MNFNRKAHWENIFQTKELKDVSWYQAVPEISLRLIRKLPISKAAHILDVGAGDSLLVDHLLREGYKNISVLDISEKALERAKNRLGQMADKVRWIPLDVTQFNEQASFDLWHDRAAFHFMTTENDIQHYIQNATQALKSGAYLIVGTFSDKGPDSCSGIAIRKYSQVELLQRFEHAFDKIECLSDEHLTPSGKTQHFSFCIFRKKTESS